jgi:hypothetical protein
MKETDKRENKIIMSAPTRCNVRPRLEPREAKAGRRRRVKGRIQKEEKKKFASAHLTESFTPPLRYEAPPHHKRASFLPP